LFHKVAIKPGKPILFARFDNGVFYFGLPGNPISTAIGFRFFVRTFLNARTGLKPSLMIRATLTASLNKKSPLREFRKAQIMIENGRLLVSELSGQESHRIAPLQCSNAWLIVDEEARSLSAGDSVAVAGLFDDILSF
jgi:molybdopterin molybdotransferase